MRNKLFILLTGIFLGFSALAIAQDEEMESALDYKVNKMQKELHLTETQALAVRPVIKDYLTKKYDLLQQVANQGIVDHVALKSSLKQLRHDEYGQLSKILTPEQMKAWIDEDNMMSSLNPDNPENSTDSDATLNGMGASMKF